MEDQSLENEPNNVKKIFLRLKENTKVIIGILYKIIGEESWIYPPPSEQAKLLEEAHKLTGHSGV